MVEIVKRILTKEMLDRQLTRQSLSTPFMRDRDGHQRRVSFDMKEELGDKIDKLAVMIGKLATRDSGTNKQFKPQIHQSRGRGQNQNYNTIQETIGIGTDQIRGQIAETEDNTDKTEVGLDMNKILGENIEETQEITAEENIGMTVIVRSRSRSRDRSFSRNYGNNRTRSTNQSRSRSGSRASTNRDRIHCYKCREYDHFCKGLSHF